MVPLSWATYWTSPTLSLMTQFLTHTLTLLADVFWPSFIRTMAEIPLFDSANTSSFVLIMAAQTYFDPAILRHSAFSSITPGSWLGPYPRLVRNLKVHAWKGGRRSSILLFCGNISGYGWLSHIHQGTTTTAEHSGRYEIRALSTLPPQGCSATCLTPDCKCALRIIHTMLLRA